MSVSCGRSCRRSVDPDAKACEQCGALGGDSPQDDSPVAIAGPTIEETDPTLLWLLRRAGEEWGPLGVARVAAQLCGPVVSVYDENWNLTYSRSGLGIAGVDGKSVQWNR